MLNGSTHATLEKEFTISRYFNAPRELVFRAFTEADRLAQWWGPKDFRMLVARMDLRPGGIFHYQMLSPEGHAMWGRFVYKEISAPERLVFINSFSDAGGNILRHPLSNTWPLEVRSTLILKETNGSTLLTMSGRPENATEEERYTFNANHPSLEQGFRGTFDQLDEYLTGIQN